MLGGYILPLSIHHGGFIYNLDELDKFRALLVLAKFYFTVRHRHFTRLKVIFDAHTVLLFTFYWL